MKRLLVLLCIVALPAPALADTESDAKALVDTWLAAQNGGDFAAYSALYDAKFVGIRRTNDGGEKKMKLKAWKADRKKMFKHTQKVAADNIKVEAVEGKPAVVSFLQRWESGSYADHGTKVLLVDPATKLILKEELLSSTPGWEDDDGEVLDATAMTSPIKLSVRGEGIRQNGDCTGVTYVLYIKDKKGHVFQHEIGGGVTMSDDESGKVSTIKIEPSDTKGLLYDMGQWCAGGADLYQVKLSGDALTIRYEGQDEGGEAPEEFNTIFTVQLPPGAKVKAK